jgi:uncharacterized membrane protein YccC
VGRQFFVISAIIALSIIASDRSHAQGGHNRSHGGQGFGRHHNQPPKGLRDMRSRVHQLSPEERQTFKKNAERWLQMNQEQRNVLRAREKVRQQQMKNEADAALRDSGLRVDPNARNQFESRYFQERRRIERQLRQEAEAKRQEQLKELNERLKSEFQPPPSSPGSTGSSGPSKPRH